LHVVLVGDIGAVEARRMVDRVFADLPNGTGRAPITPISLKPIQATEPGPGGQNLKTAVFAFPMPDLNDDNFFAGLALNHIIGSGNFDARLTSEIRVKRGLTYAIGTSVIADDVSSYALGAFSTKPAKMDEATTAITEVFKELRQNGPTKAELQNAVSQLVGNYVLRLTTSGKIADHLIGLWLDRLSPEFGERRRQKLQALTPEDLRRVAVSYLNPDQLRTLVLAPINSSAAP
ncbi:MAG: insulinase family protein, partial [Pseudomonadota bacterium]